MEVGFSNYYYEFMGYLLSNRINVLTTVKQLPILICSQYDIYSLHFPQPVLDCSWIIVIFHFIVQCGFKFNVSEGWLPASELKGSVEREATGLWINKDTEVESRLLVLVGHNKSEMLGHRNRGSDWWFVTRY